jgi:hypothetical protein
LNGNTQKKNALWEKKIRHQKRLNFNL